MGAEQVRQIRSSESSDWDAMPSIVKGKGDMFEIRHGGNGRAMQADAGCYAGRNQTHP